MKVYDNYIFFELGGWRMKSMIIDLTVENCHEALLYYKEIFGGEIKNTQLADGIDMFKGHEGKYIHSELHINENCILYLTDIFSENYIPGNNFKIVLQLNSNEEIEKQYDALTRDGQIVFPLQDTFWGSRHGVVQDKYGVTWELDYKK